MIGFVNAKQQGCRLSTGSRALVRWMAEFGTKSDVALPPGLEGGTMVMTTETQPILVGKRDLLTSESAIMFGCVVSSWITIGTIQALPRAKPVWR